MSAAVVLVLLAGLGGCAADLVPGELIVPGELPTESYRGEVGSSLGAALALDGATLLAGAPGAGQVWLLDEGEPSQGPIGLGRWVWWYQGSAYGARGTEGVFAVDHAEATLLWETPGAYSFAAGETADGFRVATTTGQAVQLWDGEGTLRAHLVLAGVQRMAVGWQRVLLQVCEAGACEAVAWNPSTASVDTLAETGDGGAVAEVDGVAWWSDPQLEDPEARGLVSSEAGDSLEGLEGDHLGRSFCNGHVAGVFNTWIVPARLRLVPLHGGSVVSIDRATPSRAPALACDGERLAVGLPTNGLHELGEGSVLVVEFGG